MGLSNDVLTWDSRDTRSNRLGSKEFRPTDGVFMQMQQQDRVFKDQGPTGATGQLTNPLTSGATGPRCARNSRRTNFSIGGTDSWVARKILVKIQIIKNYNLLKC